MQKVRYPNGNYLSAMVRWEYVLGIRAVALLPWHHTSCIVAKSLLYRASWTAFVCTAITQMPLVICCYVKTYQGVWILDSRGYLVHVHRVCCHGYLSRVSFSVSGTQAQWRKLRVSLIYITFPFLKMSWHVHIFNRSSADSSFLLRSISIFPYPQHRSTYHSSFKENRPPRWLSSSIEMLCNCFSIWLPAWWNIFGARLWHSAFYSVAGLLFVRFCMWMH